MINTKSLASHCTFTRTNEAPCDYWRAVYRATAVQYQRNCHRIANVHTAPEPHLRVMMMMMKRKFV